MKSGNSFSLPVLIIFVFGVFVSQKSLNQRYTPESALNEVMHLPDGKVLKVASMGFSSLLADFLWLKSVLYFGKYMLDEDNPYVDLIDAQRKVTGEHDHAHEHGHEAHQHEEDDHAEDLMAHLQDINKKSATRQNQSESELSLSRNEDLTMLHKFSSKGLAPYIYPLLKRVVELDPYFIAAYRFGGLIVLHETGEIDQAYELLQYGWEKNPQNWEIAYYLGFIDLLYRGDTQSSLHWLSHALLIPGHPPFIRNVYNSLVKKENYRNNVIQYLKGIYESSDDVKLREQILDMLTQMAVKNGVRP